MACTLSPTDIKTLEQTRQRLSQLATSLASLQHQVLNSDPLPPWSSLHSQTQILSQTLASLSAHLATHSSLLSATSTYPLPSYPGREQEGLLHQLLRKKLDPRVEEWAEEGKTEGEALMGTSVDDIKDFWQWAGPTANEDAGEYAWGAPLEGEESDMEDDGAEAQKRETKLAPIPMDDVLRFMMRGETGKR